MMDKIIKIAADNTDTELKFQSILLLIILILIVFFFISAIIFLVLHNKKFFVRLWGKFNRRKKKTEFKEFCSNLSGALIKLSNDNVGAIIVIERKDSLDEYINVGYKVSGEFSAEFIISVFYNKRSPLHDGAIIIRDFNIVSISSYFPMTRQLLDVSFGARHRAAIGISERTDAFVFVVSETNGRIVFIRNGKMQVLSRVQERLYDEIVKVFDIK